MENGLSYYNCKLQEVESRIAKNKKVKIGDNPHVGLHLKILSAEGIDNPSLHPSVGNRHYHVVLCVNPGEEFHTKLAEGLLDPVWNAEGVILLRRYPDKHAFLNLEVLRIMSMNDPGTSSGMVLVGKARIPLPKELYCEKTGRFGLVRTQREGYKAEGHIKLSMQLRRYNNNLP